MQLVSQSVSQTEREREEILLQLLVTDWKMEIRFLPNAEVLPSPPLCPHGF
jgi:hypothetical protein